MFHRARHLLRALGVKVEETYAVRNPSRLPETVHGALERGCELIILGGGDGTVSSAVDSLANRDVTLGILPLGTANDFARTLEIPFSLEKACETVARGKVVDVDLGLIGDNYYVNVASVGLGAEVTRTLSPLLKRYFGALAYPAAAAITFFRHKPFSATISFPHEDYPTATFERLLQVAVGNGRFYGGGMVVAPGSSLEDRVLDVYAIELGTAGDLAGVVRYFKSGEFTQSGCVSHYKTTRVRIETTPQLPVNVDGELVARTPDIFSVAPNALKVLVPIASTVAKYDVDGQ